MKRTMKQAMMDKLTTHYFNKRGMTIAEAKELSPEDLHATGLPQVVREHVGTMDSNANEFSVARVIAALGTESTATRSAPVVYTPEQEVAATNGELAKLVEEYTDQIESAVAAEPAVEAPVVIAPEVVSPEYAEEDLRRIIESVEQNANANTLMKRVKAAMDKEYVYSVDLLTALCKEYAALAKK